MLGRYVLREVLPPFLVGVLLFVALLTFDLLSSLSGVLLSRGQGRRTSSASSSSASPGP
ncbi:hypothetical protein A0O31_01415 [Thermus brockianus]|uniref:Uncharacterized protein n=1 Tax=Thermus brockianus TaxID=56956 RepID=A0A1J0LU65_THEBO|nr:hypothetical protein A0O31_01415 [Thermus brockianus]